MTSPSLSCRRCGATPAARRDDVSPSAIEYECSWCLLGLAAEAARPGGAPAIRPRPAPLVDRARCLALADAPELVATVGRVTVRLTCGRYTGAQPVYVVAMEGNQPATRYVATEGRARELSAALDARPERPAGRRQRVQEASHVTIAPGPW